MEKNEIIEKIRMMLPSLSSRYHIKEIELFGSYARNDATKTSDIDLLVTFVDTPDLLTFIELEETLSRSLDHQVDLVMKRKLKSQIKNEILQDAIAV